MYCREDSPPFFRTTQLHFLCADSPCTATANRLGSHVEFGWCYMVLLNHGSLKLLLANMFTLRSYFTCLIDATALSS